MNNREDLISRKAAMSVLNQETVFCVKNFKDGEARGYAGAREIIANLPAVDAVEVVHAKWEAIMDFGGGNCIGYCSNCHTEHKAQNGAALKAGYRHCRWCGARMDGE